MSNAQVCSGSKILIFACSGAADVGAISDKAARELTKEGVGKMYCTVGLGGRAEPILKTTREAETIVALDGCPLDCVKKSLDNLDFHRYKHVRLTDLGLKKGKSEMTPDNVFTVKEKVKEAII